MRDVLFYTSTAGKLTNCDPYWRQVPYSYAECCQASRAKLKAGHVSASTGLQNGYTRTTNWTHLETHKRYRSSIFQSRRSTEVGHH